MYSTNKWSGPPVLTHARMWSGCAIAGERAATKKNHSMCEHMSEIIESKLKAGNRQMERREPLIFCFIASYIGYSLPITSRWFVFSLFYVLFDTTIWFVVYCINVGIFIYIYFYVLHRHRLNTVTLDSDSYLFHSTVSLRRLQENGKHFTQFISLAARFPTYWLGISEFLLFSNVLFSQIVI